ncbi:MAG: hypothetical protein MUE30_13645 [Spirosomaceae bacterium]|jgi:hypothetical protein|nr:hypothetical protein [Spirosomataceae bacterium]
MNRKSKMILGVTVALITAASLRIVAGHHHWRHHPSAQHHPRCESRWHQQNHDGHQKSDTQPQTNQQLNN